MNQKDLECAQLRERLDLETVSLLHEKDSVERKLHDLEQRYQSFVQEHQALEQKQSRQERCVDGQEQQLRQREQELEDREQHLRQQLAEQHRSLQHKQEELIAMERLTSDLDQKRQDFEQQRAEMEQQLERQRQELERQMKEQREKHRKNNDADKENRVLRQTVQEQKSALYELQRNSMQEQTAASFLSPGELLKLSRKQEGDTFAHENAALKLRLHGIDTDVREVRWHNEVLKKYLPAHARELVAKEMSAVPLGVQEPSSVVTRA